MSYTISNDTEYPRITPAVQWLIALNVAIYFLQVTVVSPVDMFPALGFEMKNLEELRWWTIGTYMFVHGGFWHLLMNMFMLWTFGPRLEHAWSTSDSERRSFGAYYLFCGLGGLVFHFFLARNGLLIGASAAVLGVMLAYAMRWPDDEVLFAWVIPMKVKWLVAFLAVMNLVMAVSSTGASSGTAWQAHLGGLAFGWLFLHKPSANSVGRLRQRIEQAPDVPDEAPRAIPRSLPRNRERQGEIDDVVAKSKALVARRPMTTRRMMPLAKKTEEMNRVLDKISQTGLASLTTAEKRLLEEMSRELRDEE
jgi:membrane associated rhomboid family serine protease